jgi:hypothetical protein
VTRSLLAALSWDPEVKGALYVLIAALTLCGSCYLLLATNLGARLGFLLAAAGLLGWLVTSGIVWWVYGQGIAQKAPQAGWKEAAVVTGDLGASSRSFLEGFPRGWRKLDPSDKEVADAIPVAEADLISSPGGPPRPFKSASEFMLLNAYEKGGERWGPFGLDFRPFNVFHKARYLAIQVQKVQAQQAPPGAPAARPAPDPSAQPISVVLLRDLGAKRLYPAVFTISCGILFGLVCYQLHVRDKEAAARREAQTGAGSGRLQPVAR